ncbi:MAG: molybdopterin oxidoreductase molybdopterin-binding subunit [Acidimicrobiia bacterium]|nr:MAG: molybdopterin oxidoreductase molybdopterin-binding subunit [Acidimicrobiia bacterium]
MVAVTRRSFLKGSAAVGGGVLASDFLFGGLETLRKTNKVLLADQLTEDYVHTTCWIGKQDCGMRVRRIDGRPVKLEGLAGHPRNDGTLCPKGQAQIISFYDPNRVKTPLIRTNAKGEPGAWRRASWDEALDLVATKVKEVLEEDPKLVLWQKGRSKAKDFYDDAFVKALGCSKLGHGAYCSDTGYRAVEYTVGLHGVLHPDLLNAQYVLSWGWNITNAGGNKFCWITWPRQMLDAMENGLKIVHIDPRLRPAGPFADRWVPIRPATDLAFALALIHELIAQGYVDRPYLTTYTNAPYLVGPDGLFLRDEEDTPLVWDETTRRAVPVGTADSPALEGTYTVDGAEAKTAFELLKEHVASYTPEWASEICGIEAEQIRRIATEFGEHARIGSTVVVDGVEVPYRPVGIMAYHMAQQELGFQALRAMCIVPMLVGAWGAVGGQTADFTWKVDKNYAAFEELKVEEPPYDFTLKNSKFFPINSGFPGIVAKVMQDPERYEVDKLPKVMILHHVNPVVSFASQPDFLEAYKKLEFVAAITPWMSETADLFADVVLPCATIEKYEGPISATDGYIDAVTLRLPPMEPLLESRGEIDIYMDLSERIGVLYGEGGYLSVVNEGLGLTETEFALSLEEKPTVREIFDRWSKAQGLEGISYFEQNGVLVKGAISPTKRYGYVTDPPFGGAVHRLYGESLLKAQRMQQEMGADLIYWQDYTPLPTWREPTMWSSPADYEFTLITYKLVEHKQSRTTTVPLLAELSGPQRLEMNATVGRAKGFEDGDEVVVESHNALTGETRRLKTRIRLIEGIRPDVVGMPHHFGMWSHPSSQGLGPTPNEIFYTGEGYMGATADASFHVRVRVFKE